LEKIRQKLKWNKWPEYGKTGFFIVLIIGVTLTGYGVFTLAMGTSSPLVVVTSTSMSPTFEIGHLLVLQSQAPEDINVGDIVVYNATWHYTAPVVHRVVQREYIGGEYWYTLQGDNNANPDPVPITYDRIIGVVVFAIPWIGNITLFLQTPGVLPVVIILLLVIMIIPEFLPQKNEEKESEEGTSEPDSDVLNA